MEEKRSEVLGVPKKVETTDETLAKKKVPKVESVESPKEKSPKEK